MAYIRSITSLLFKPSKSTLPQIKKSRLTALPPPILEHIFSYLSTDEFTRLSNTCITLREKASTFLPTRRQQLLVQARILQSTIPAANLPNELLHEIFTYLTPKDFYTATKVCASWRYAGVYPPLIKKTHIHPTSGRNLSTIQLEQPNSKIPPEIHLSETGHYFLSAERAPPYHVHIYGTYRPVLANDFEAPQLRSQIKNPTPRFKGVSEHAPWEPGSGALGFHEWDSTPTYMVALRRPCYGKVVSASFSPALFGGVRVVWQSSSKYVQCQEANNWSRIRRHVQRNYSNGGLSNKYLDEETSRKIIFATEGHLMVYEGISEHKLKKVLEGDSKWTYWDKQTIVEKAYHLSGGSPIERIFPSRSKNGGYPEDSFICHFEPDQIDALDIKPIELLSSLSTLPYTDLTACEDYSSTSLYFGLDCSDYSLTYLKLYHSEEELYKPCTLMPKRRYPHPHAIPAHTTSVRIPWHSTHPIIATATAEGQIYISFPPLCNSSKLACRSSDSGFRRIKLKCTCPPTAFKKLARIPPATGGRITDMKISYRSPVLDSPRRNVVYLKDLEAMKGEIGILVLLIGTDRGRLEVCYFGPESKEVDTKRLWVARGSEIENKSDLGDFK
ncbi:uncharacterized protein H6S33_000706 [Morchella sextelata]|uniref:uncharacterized protein n=1 Tax=Morchella sextelata TaxID=1174677 RepID=UPI001D049EBC|nr:uncharacterized protein H6S33_000706 [Morchella sextelata]KAH0615070.1 hypothetical protein H6S33_000706 [Morchella sextelata]